jgi:hypothetical protein
MKKTAIAGMALLIAGCATSSKRETSVPPEVSAPRIDLLAVQHDLGMDDSSGRVGYREKRFDACRFAADLPGIPDCSRAMFVQIGIQLSCRLTEESGSDTLDPVERAPLAGRDLRWILEGLSGRIRTDPAGFGLILTIASRSLKKQRLRVSTGEDFLMIRAGQATEIVTPASWCRSEP